MNRLFRHLRIAASFILLLPYFNLELHAQEKTARHPAQTKTILPGLRRAFNATLSDISIEVNPGWQAEESYDNTHGISRLVFSSPKDSSHTFLSCLVEPYHVGSFDSVRWNKLKESIRESYGNRGIAVHEIGETIFFSSRTDSSGILARYELLARHDDYLEFVVAILADSEMVLLTAPIKEDEYQAQMPYLRDMAESLRLHSAK